MLFSVQTTFGWSISRFSVIQRIYGQANRAYAFGEVCLCLWRDRFRVGANQQLENWYSRFLCLAFGIEGTAGEQADEFTSTVGIKRVCVDLNFQVKASIIELS